MPERQDHALGYLYAHERAGRREVGRADEDRVRVRLDGFTQGVAEPHACARDHASKPAFDPIDNGVQTVSLLEGRDDQPQKGVEIMQKELERQLRLQIESVVFELAGILATLAPKRVDG